MPSAHPITVLYDADCGLCRHTARVLQAIDPRGRLRFVPLQELVATAPDAPSRAELEARLHVRDGRGRWYAGGEALLRIAATTPLLLPLALVGRLPGMTRIAEHAYRLVADHRHEIGRWVGVDRCDFEPRPPADEGTGSG